ncbi:tail length tape-measure protein [Salmonella phage 39]|nr:tail length tape-measure protein [Salmonella phage 39]
MNDNRTNRPYQRLKGLVPNITNVARFDKGCEFERHGWT